MQGQFSLKNNKRADQNKAVQGDFFLKIDKRACTSIRYTRVVTSLRVLSYTNNKKRRERLDCPSFHVASFGQKIDH